MFIRYNQGIKFWEYDTSPGQTGAGPWLILPIDGTLIAGGPAGSIAYTNLVNEFTQPQRLKSGTPTIQLFNTGGPADGKAIWLEDFSDFYISMLNDIGDTYLKRFIFQRNGDASFPGGFLTQGIITSNSAIRANAGLESRGNNGQIIMLDAGGPVNARTWRFVQYNTSHLYLEFLNDSLGILINPVTFGADNIIRFNGAYTQHAGGIYLPNSQSNPSLLDHYEEGTFLPTLVSDAGGAGTAYSLQTGTYTKVGNLVTVGFDVQISAASWASGNVLIGGFPFANNANSFAAGSIGYFSGLGLAVYGLLGYLSPSFNAMYLAAKTASSVGIDANLQVSHIIPGSRFIGSVTYLAAS